MTKGCIFTSILSFRIFIVIWFWRCICSMGGLFYGLCIQALLYSLFFRLLLCYIVMFRVFRISKQKHCTFLLEDIEPASVHPYDHKSQ